MTAWNRTLFLVLLASSLVAFGCGDDEGPADTGTAGDTGTVGDTGTGTDGSTDAGMCPAVGDFHEGIDHCINAADLTAAARTDYGDDMDLTVPDIAGTCARGCLSDPEPAVCTTTCIVMGTGGDMSATCASCYTGSTGCAGTLCLAECISPDTAAECAACRGGTNACSFNCTQEFENCFGTVGGTDAGTGDGGAADAAADAGA